MLRLRRTAALALSLSSLVAGCQRATIEGTVPAPRAAVSAGKMLAGAGKTDLTPMAGFPMGGHAIGGKVSRGYWTRLYARAFYFEDPSGVPLVLVSCDLWAMPAGVGDRVAEILAANDATAHIGRENILLAATHTHHSQGNFASSAAVNDFAQPLPGFDPELFEFVTQQIAAAVRNAHATREPAAVFRSETRLSGFFRNRSMEAFLLDLEHRDVLAANSDLDLCKTSAMFPDPRACHAVDPRVSVLRIESVAATPRLIGIAAFAASHPTVMTHDLEVYSADVFGTASVLAEEALPRAEGMDAPVVALFNGAQGDITTTWERQDRRSVIRLAEQLSAAIVEQRLGGTRLADEIRIRAEIMPIADTCFTDGEGTRRCTPVNGVPGASAIGGAEDGPTVLADMGYREGRRSTRREAHGSKLPAFDLDFGSIRLKLTDLVSGGSDIPKAAPLAVYRLGDVVLATLPGEFTTVMGRRIAAQLQSVQPTAGRVLLVGLANEYVNYFTSPEEYDLQHYEGGMTLYGQAAATLIGHHLATLAAKLEQPQPPAVSRPFKYSAGKAHHFTMEEMGAPLYRRDDGLSSVLLDLDSGDPRRDFPCACWTDTVTDMKAVLAGRPAVPQVSIEAGSEQSPLHIDGRAQSDAGIQFVSQVTEADAKQSRWCSFWMPPAGTPSSLAVRFRVVGLDGATRLTSTFLPLSSFPDRCLDAARAG